VADPFVKLGRPASAATDPDDPLNNPSSLLPDSASVKECADFLSKFVGGKALIARIQETAQDYVKAVRPCSPER
jgi:hypothetical protein